MLIILGIIIIASVSVNLLLLSLVRGLRKGMDRMYAEYHRTEER
jgi:hypothetical protein